MCTGLGDKRSFRNGKFRMDFMQDFFDAGSGGDVECVYFLFGKINCKYHHLSFKWVCFIR